MDDANDTTARYREYLRRFGIPDAGDRVAELRDLDVGGVRFFAYAGGDGLRLKAAATPDGLVTPGARPGDDWYGFISNISNASVAAERIAWLETNVSAPAHGSPTPPAAALVGDRPAPVGVDPAQWALVTAPTLRMDAHAATLVAWLLPGDTRVPTRWKVVAPPRADATIERDSALDVLTARAGGAAAAADDAAARARAILASGTDDERLWALQQIGGSGDRTAILSVTALLANAAESANVRLHAAGALARIGSTAAVPALSASLRSDGAPEVRRASAQALGSIGGDVAVRGLLEARSSERDATVRAEITQALATHGIK